MSEWWERRRRGPFDFEIRVSGLFGGKPFSLRVTPEGIRTSGWEGFVRRTPPPPGGEAEREPLIDIMEERGEVVVVAEMPGVEREQIEVEAAPERLTISAEAPGRKYYKEVATPAKVDPSSSKASYKNGVLEVRLAKVRESKGERIRVD